MKNQLNTMKYIVQEVLETNFLARGNDILLAEIVLDRMGMSTDLRKIRKEWEGNILASIWRTRRKLQEQFPDLKPTEEIQKHREENRNDYKEWVINN